MTARSSELRSSFDAASGAMRFAAGIFLCPRQAEGNDRRRLERQKWLGHPPDRYGQLRLDDKRRTEFDAPSRLMWLEVAGPGFVVWRPSC
jgi:hypothetical protein